MEIDWLYIQEILHFKAGINVMISKYFIFYNKKYLLYYCYCNLYCSSGLNSHYLLAFLCFLAFRFYLITQIKFISFRF